MFFGNKDKFHFRAIRKDDEKSVRNIIFSILGDYGLELNIEEVDKDLFDIVEAYKDGLFGVVELIDEHKIIGSFALFPISNEVVELRKMYLQKEFRGQGIGRWIMQFIEAYSISKGFKLITLESASVLKEALFLYEKSDFVHSNACNHTSRCDIMMEKVIA